jgi:hypothetical protein
MSPLGSAIAIRLLAKAGVEGVRAIVGKDARAIATTWEEQKEELLMEATVLLQRVVEQYGSLDERVSEGEIQRAWMATQLEAFKSPDRERVRMLAGAFAGYFMPNMEMEAKNRAFRAAQQLEPSDIVYLRLVSNSLPDDRRILARFLEHEMSDHALVTAGCFRDEVEWPDEASQENEFPTRRLSFLGDALVALMKAYRHPSERETARPSDLPAGFRSVET